MDIYSLVAANLHPGSHSASMGARAEDRYYAGQFALPRLGLVALKPLAFTICAVLVLGVALL